MLLPTPYGPAFLSPRALVRYRSVPFRPVLPCPYSPVVIPGIEMNRNKAEKSRNNPTIKNILFSSPLQMPTAPVNEKVGHKRHQRKNIKSTSINHILPFVIRNLSPAARNSDGRETPDDSQRETNGRGRKSEYPAELTFQLLACLVVVVQYLSSVR